MLVFRKGQWYTIEVPLSDPLLSEHHRQELASTAVSWIVRGASFTTAIAEAEKALYMRLYRKLKLPRE